MHAQCKVTGCGWVSDPQPVRFLAECLSVWHVYDNHRDIWNELAGDRLPDVPDVRNLAVRCAIIGLEAMSEPLIVFGLDAPGRSPA